MSTSGSSVTASGNVYVSGNQDENFYGTFDVMAASHMTRSFPIEEVPVAVATAPTTVFLDARQRRVFRAPLPAESEGPVSSAGVGGIDGVGPNTTPAAAAEFVVANTRSKRVSHQNQAQPEFIVGRDGAVRINSNTEAPIISVKQHWRGPKSNFQSGVSVV